MFSEVLRPGITQGQYPERDDARKNTFDAALHNTLGMFRRWSLKPARHADQFVARVNAASAVLQPLGAGQFRQRVDAMRQQLACAGLDEQSAAECFAMVREAAGRTLGQRHYDTQILGGWLMLSGKLAEMETGEGKTLTATLTAGTAALAGIPVHVITANDYLARRDAETLAPVYELLGLSVGAVTEEAREPNDRRQVYACNITYCTPKQVAFDYLRDRVAMGARRGQLDLQVRQLTGQGGDTVPLLLRGLCFAIVDEADSVLIDDAGTPLILSRECDKLSSDETYLQALQIAAQMKRDHDYRLHSRYNDVELTHKGRVHLLEQVADLPAPWNRQGDAEALLTQALRASHCYLKDRDYLVRDNKIQIIDGNTGRVMPDHSWERGLHQMVEAKESCEITGERQTLARISYQRFFRRYLHLCGMSGTVQEVAGELWSVYGLDVVRMPTFRPVRRTAGRDRIYASAAAKWQAIAARAAEIQRSGRPVLIGTSSVEDSEQLSQVLTEAGILHTVLNARQDHQEAAIVARAGQAGVVTVATNMAGRGTDIKLQRDVVERGGLHVIAANRNEARRIDRQLYGRCGRQGDPGSYQAILSLEDALLKKHLPPTLKGMIRSIASRSVPLPVDLIMRVAQRLAERHHALLRKNLLKLDEGLGEAMAYTGPIE